MGIINCAEHLKKMNFLIGGIISKNSLAILLSCFKETLGDWQQLFSPIIANDPAAYNYADILRDNISA